VDWDLTVRLWRFVYAAGAAASQALSRNFNQLRMRSQAKQMSGDDCSLDAQESKQATPVFLLKC